MGEWSSVVFPYLAHYFCTYLCLQRMDMGECSRVHDLALRADYEAAQASRDHFYDVDACDYLLQFVTDIDKKIVMSKKNLAETQEALSGEVTDIIIITNITLIIIIITFR